MQSSSPRLLRAAWRASLLLGLVALGGCSAFVFYTGSEDAESAEQRTEPGGFAPVTPPYAASAPAPVPVPPASAPPPPRIVVLSSAVPAHADVARDLLVSLTDAGYRVEPFEIGAQISAQRIEQLRGRSDVIAVAVGYDAARAARDELGVPTVFCQVFNHQDLGGGAVPLWGIDSIPPLELQLRAWKQLDPSLGRLGMIVSEGHARLVEQSERAALQAGLTLEAAVSTSDRETLYHFRRLAREIDGLWLFPDNRILSPAAIAELLRQASLHGVQVLAVNAPLPSGGALMSASGSTRDLTAAVRYVLDRVVRGETMGLAQMTPLREVLVQVDERAAARLELPPPPHASWVLDD
jgi:hypothetical protein